MATTLADTAMGNHTTREAESPIASVHLSVDFFAKISEGDWLEVRSRLGLQGKRLLFLSSTGSLTIEFCVVFFQDAKI
jgi:acyl-coenzyme A thioesterase PaaI-like protein